MRPVRSLAHSPLFQVMFSWQNTEPGTFDLPALERKPVAAAPHILAKFDLTLSLGGYRRFHSRWTGIRYSSF